MVDTFTRAERSRIMRSITSSGTKPEKLLKQLLRKNGFTGWRQQFRKLPGRPDFALPRQKTVIFVDGCFWHGCLKCYRKPKSNLLYWRKKLLRNRKRDQLINKQIIEQGWKIVRLWEHDVRLAPDASMNLIRKAAKLHCRNNNLKVYRILNRNLRK